jgi:hypothetical protein
MVWGESVLMRGVWNGTLYNMLGSTITDGCNSFVIPKGGIEKHITLTISKENTMTWNQILGHIRDKGLQELHGKHRA